MTLFPFLYRIFGAKFQMTFFLWFHLPHFMREISNDFISFSFIYRIFGTKFQWLYFLSFHITHFGTKFQITWCSTKQKQIATLANCCKDNVFTWTLALAGIVTLLLVRAFFESRWLIQHYLTEKSLISLVFFWWIQIKNRRQHENNYAIPFYAFHSIHNCPKWRQNLELHCHQRNWGKPKC